ncbi:hypothetical protein TNCV_2251501 [Trichonephila clavipes]|nr:hypothetical protein TNCV_2251501 [Trichonephila clavipes]
MMPSKKLDCPDGHTTGSIHRDKRCTVLRHRLKTLVRMRSESRTVIRSKIDANQANMFACSSPKTFHVARYPTNVGNVPSILQTRLYVTYGRHYRSKEIGKMFSNFLDSDVINIVVEHTELVRHH